LFSTWNSGDKKTYIHTSKEVLYMQGRKLYIGNLEYTVTHDDLKELFSSYGEVTYIKVIEDRGFGFVEMSKQSEAEQAKEALNGSKFKGRILKVNEARPQKNRGGRAY
jgi:RNA recognition motif-containing protein